MRQRNEQYVWVVIARSEVTKQSILLYAKAGLLRFARNDGLISWGTFRIGLRAKLQLRGAETCGGPKPGAFFGFSVPA
jgi:hypothetical protein